MLYLAGYFCNHGATHVRIAEYFCNHGWSPYLGYFCNQGPLLESSPRDISVTMEDLWCEENALYLLASVQPKKAPVFGEGTIIYLAWEHGEP